jgi:hypothetical protein
VRDDLRRNRLTVFFRLLLAIPPLVWLAIPPALVSGVLNCLTELLAFLGWFVCLVLGRMLTDRYPSLNVGLD